MLRDNMTLYYSSWKYNAARITTELARIAENNGATVKPGLKNAFLVNRSMMEIRRDAEKDLERLEEARDMWADKIKNIDLAMDCAAVTLEELESLNEERDKVEERLHRVEERSKSTCAKLADLAGRDNGPTPISHDGYISFVLEGNYYYVEFADNPFFDHHYQKTAVRNGRRSRDAYLEKLEALEKFGDPVLGYNFTSEDVREAAEMVFHYLVNAPASGIHREKTRRRVPNTYNSGYHYETVYEPERFEALDWIA